MLCHVIWLQSIRNLLLPSSLHAESGSSKMLISYCPTVSCIRSRQSSYSLPQEFQILCCIAHGTVSHITVMLQVELCLKFFVRILILCQAFYYFITANTKIAVLISVFLISLLHSLCIQDFINSCY
jgi:hypothetical protein